MNTVLRVDCQKLCADGLVLIGGDKCQSMEMISTSKHMAELIQ